MILLNSLNKNSEKIKLFITTGLQGFYKILILLILEFNYGLTEVAKVGVHLSIAQIVITISSIGFVNPRFLKYCSTSLSFTISSLTR